jgi:prepilin-type N-terminal cleavage/methylation domain-containing protein
LAFTLTELLVVITIIAVLAALSTAGVMRAMSTARQTGMKTELDQLDAALKSYKEKYGSYPPCNLDLTNTQALAALRSHVARAFPRYNIAGLQSDLQQVGLRLDAFRPDQALVFWLKGFSPDVSNPFVSADGQQIVYNPSTNTSTKTGPVKTSPFFEFDQGRLLSVAAGESPAYFPRGVKVTSSVATPYPQWTSGGGPFVYFDPANYQRTAANCTTNTPAQPFEFNANPIFYASAGAAVPYWNDANNNRSTCTTGADESENWANPDSIQIIATGLDGRYGLGGTPPLVARLYPTGFSYDPAGTDDDNVSNFCTSARMGDAKP